MKKLTRREFVRVSSLAAAATVAAACARPAPTAAPAPTSAAAQPAAPTAALKPTTAIVGTSATAAPPTAAPTLAAVEGPRFKEAPMLADLVAAGKLPPVDERLPKNPCIIESHAGIGKYGGSLRRGFNGVSDSNGPGKVNSEGLTWYNIDLSVRANMAESWEISEDGSRWTVHLREGTKYSDGTPFTTESVRFYHEHIQSNKDLVTSYASQWSTGTPRVLPTLETPDDFTFIVTFAEPKPMWAFDCTRFVPQHPGFYTQQFHAEFAKQEDLEKQAVEKGFETWMDLYNDRNTWFKNPELPILGPWRPLGDLAQELFEMERNPYFWQVDPEGQQLPYIDRVIHRLFETPDVFNMWIVNGEIDFQNRHVAIANYTLFKENEASGDFQLYLGVSASHLAMQLNLTTKNDRLREFFNKREVRIAVSHAVNREEINEIVYDGLATPRQYSPIEQSPQYYPELSNAYIEYDPDKANQLLDEAGYTEKDAEGFRVWPGTNEPISWIFEGTSASGTPDEDAALMIQTYLADVGLKATYKYFERALYTEHYSANEIEAAFWGGDRTVLPMVAPWIFVGTNTDRPWACGWALWTNSNGKDPNGVEPPEDHWIREIWALRDKMFTEPDDAKRNEYFRGILDIWKTELPQVTFLGQFPAPIIVKNGLMGYLPGMPIDDTTEDEHLLNTQAYFWDEPEKH